MLKQIRHQLENLNREIPGLQAKISKAESSIFSLSHFQSSLINKMTAKTETIDSNPFSTLNSIQVRIDENVRIMAELHARWEREDEISRNKEITKVCSI